MTGRREGADDARMPSPANPASRSSDAVSPGLRPPAQPLLPQPAGIPLPRPGAVSAPFWEGCARGELLFQRCGGCRAALFDPMVRCRSCGSAGLTWERSAGLGAVYSWSTVWRPQTPAFATPYAVVIVTLDEGYHMLSNLVGCGAADVHVGLRVAVTFHEAGDGAVLPYFTPAAPAPPAGPAEGPS